MAVDMDEAQERFAELVRLAENGQDVVISREGKSVVRLTKLQPFKRAIQFGLLEGKIHVAADFGAPLPPKVLAEFEGGE